MQTDTTLILRPLAKQFVRLASFFAINSPAAMCSQPVSMHDNILRSICKNSEPRHVYRTTARQLALHRTTTVLVCRRDTAPRVVVLSTGPVATHSDSVLRSWFVIRVAEAKGQIHADTTTSPRPLRIEHPPNNTRLPVARLPQPRRATAQRASTTP